MNLENAYWNKNNATRSHSAQGVKSLAATSGVKIPLPPRLWITDFEDESSDDGSIRDDGILGADRPRVRSRYRHYKKRGAIPIGIFWDIENCHVPRGCSALDVVASIRAKFLTGRREADFVVVCDVRKESAYRLQELNDAQISVIHVCGTQKNAADEKLRQCMRRFSELHSAPAALLLISGDINFAADLSDFRHRKNMEVILVHKRETSQALIACASSNYYFSDITANLPRNKKALSHSEEDEDPTCELEVMNLPLEFSPEKVAKRLRRLADNCGGKVVRVDLSTAILRFPTPDHASRALKRMDGEDVFGRKISTRFARSAFAPAYSSDEGYSTAPVPAPPPRPAYAAQVSPSPIEVTAQVPRVTNDSLSSAASEWALALQQLPAAEFFLAPAPTPAAAPASAPAPRLRKIRGTHGSMNLDRSGCSSSNSLELRDTSQSRAQSPWNCSGSFSEQSDCDDCAELTVCNLPPYDPLVLQDMLTQLFRQFVNVLRVSVWAGADGPLASVVVRSEWDARLAIARVHKRRLEAQWNGRRLELALGRPCPSPSLDVLRARLRAILLDHTPPRLPLLRLRDAYASRHATALTTSDLAKVKDTVIIHEGFGRIVQLLDLSPVSTAEMEEAPWKCQIHAGLNTSHEDGSRILQPVFMEIATMEKHVQLMLETHGGIVPLLSFVECYSAMFPPLCVDGARGVTLELLLRSVRCAEVRDSPSRHLAPRPCADLSESSRSSGERDRPRTAPVLEPMLALFERELIDLLKSAPRCCIPFSKLIPAFHHHFGRQCRVADYGFTKLPDLLAALSATIVVLGSGSSRVITISAGAQARRWTSDLVKLLKCQPGRVVYPHEIPQLYQAVFGRPFSPVDYGVCTVGELMARVQSDAVLVSTDGSLSLPRRTPTPEESARTVQFAMQAVELLCYTPNLRMEFSRFVPAYHAHFGRQLRVAHYGCVKLLELFELIPEAVSIGAEMSGERSVRLAPRAAQAVIAQRLETIAPVPFASFSAQYAAQYGASPQPEALDVCSLEALIYACGGSVEEGVVRAAADSARWASSQLAACAVLAADRSVARGSTQDYFISAFRRIRGFEPEIHNLEASGVLEICDRRLVLTSTWRVAWRVAEILADQTPRKSVEILQEYYLRHDPTRTTITVESLVEVLERARAVFVQCGAGGAWAVRGAVRLPRAPAAPAAAGRAPEDYSVLDTPPGQKGSRVFESPRSSIWCSPPASALPAPTALLPVDNKRRTRLAAHFNEAS